MYPQEKPVSHVSLLHVKVLYINGNETITVSEEIGDAYPKDPIITICASDNTISKVIEGIK